MWQWPFVLITMRRWEAEGRRMRRGRVWFGRRDGGGGGEGLRVKAKLGGEAWGLVGEKGWRLSVVEEGLGSCGGQGSGRDWSVRIGRSRLRSWSFGRGRVDDFGFVREGKWKTWSHILHYTDVLRVPVGPQIMMEIKPNYSSRNVHWLRGKYIYDYVINTLITSSLKGNRCFCPINIARSRTTETGAHHDSSSSSDPCTRTPLSVPVGENINNQWW